MEMTVTEEFSLVCQSSVVSAFPGDDVVLSCQLEPAISATSMEVKWWSYSTPRHLVCHYKYGSVKEGRGYAGRVHLSEMDLDSGNVSLKIRDVRRSQGGDYACEVIHQQQIKKQFVHLNINPVDIRLVVPIGCVCANQGTDVTLCVHVSPETSAVSMEVIWFKEGLIIHEYKDGKETAHRYYENRVGLIIQELERGHISLTLKNVQYSDSGSYKCQVVYEDYSGSKKVYLKVRASRDSDDILRGYFNIARISHDKLKYLKHLLETDRYWKSRRNKYHRSIEQTLERHFSWILGRRVKKILQNLAQNSVKETVQDLLPQLPQHILFVRDNDDDMDDDGNNKTLVLFDPPPTMETISSLTIQLRYPLEEMPSTDIELQHTQEEVPSSAIQLQYPDEETFSSDIELQHTQEEMPSPDKEKTTTERNQRKRRQCPCHIL